ncbi:MAG: CDP-alcohol phosphatidyltransferase family protein [Chloroflexi bacterium]|nr:CDP-alcohol phosphatidyltransferase family protein [Chloroflexota bacterium]
MLTNWLRKVTRGIVQPIARVLIRLGASPNLLTILGCLINLAAAVIIALVDLRWGALVLAVAMFFDAFDGAVAREMNRVTAFGGFLDSSLDRVSEFSVLLALAWRCLQSTEPRNALLALVATFGSMMVSYARARAEGIGVRCHVGLLSRVERGILILIGLVSGLVVPMLWILAIGTLLTSAQRMIYVYLQSSKMSAAKVGKNDNLS